MSEFAEKLKKRHEEQELKRFGDIIEECVSRGCDTEILYALDTRVWMYPVKQAEVILSATDNKYTDKDRLHKTVQQYKVLLEVLIEKRPDNGMVQEWKEALKLLSEMQ